MSLYGFLHVRKYMDFYDVLNEKSQGQKKNPRATLNRISISSSKMLAPFNKNCVLNRKHLRFSLATP